MWKAVKMNDFGKLSAIIFQLNYNFQEYTKLKNSIKPSKQIELLEVMVKMCIDDFFENK